MKKVCVRTDEIQVLGSAPRRPLTVCSGDKAMISGDILVSSNSFGHLIGSEC